MLLICKKSKKAAIPKSKTLSVSLRIYFIRALKIFWLREETKCNEQIQWIPCRDQNTDYQPSNTTSYLLIIRVIGLCQVCSSTQRDSGLCLILATCEPACLVQCCKPVIVLGQLPEDVLKARHATHTQTHTAALSSSSSSSSSLENGPKADSLCSVKASKIPWLSQNSRPEPSHIFCCHPQGPNENPWGAQRQIVSAHPHAIYTQMKMHIEYDSSRSTVEAKYPLKQFHYAAAGMQ